MEGIINHWGNNVSLYKFVANVCCFKWRNRDFRSLVFIHMLNDASADET